MQILLLRHYPPAEGPSMRTFADQIASGLRSRGCKVNEITAPVLLGCLLPRSHAAAKWLGYIDQYLIFPPFLWFRARSMPLGTLCVLVDQALAPWLWWLGRRPHVVHCHDLLALEAALELQPFHRLGPSGRWYQHWILRGFRRGRCFLSVSAATQRALESHLLHQPLLSAVLYNFLPDRFCLLPPSQATASLRRALPGLHEHSFILHIGSVWYKNRLGVLEIWRQLHILGSPLHLVLLGANDAALQAWMELHPHLRPWLHVLERASDVLVVELYNRASVLLYPSHAEGFGWPILEALACGCPVITTNRPPMTEVGGDAVTTIAPVPPPPQAMDNWAWKAAQRVQQVLSRSASEQEHIRQLGFTQARRFQLELWLDQLEAYYRQAMALQDNGKFNSKHIYLA